MIYLTFLVMLILVALFGVIAFFLRVVVPTNAVHIVQSSKKTISYGKDQPAGNTYYAWPPVLPFLGVRRIILPVSVFAQNLNDYAAYDKGRVPFIIDIIAFFRIIDSNVAAQRVSDMKELMGQLEYILKGAIRTILASSEIETILEGRSEFGKMFTEEVDEQLKNWGVQNVKCIELMDIRDTHDSQAIANIMAKKKSHIEMQSRIEVAGNMQTAEVAEVIYKQTVEMRKRESEESIGKRAAERDQEIGIANQKAQQAIKEEERATATKDMAVKEVNAVRAAEITRTARLVVADQDKQVAVITRDQQVTVADQGRQVAVISADADKQKMVLEAEGNLEAAKRRAQGVEVEGLAKGEAEKAVLLAPVTAQITLAKEIGANPGYQTYLVSIRQIEANQVIGIEQAKALTAAQIKVIANAGNVIEGVDSVMGLLSPKGGTQLGAMFEAFKNTPAGKMVLDALSKRVNGDARP